MTGMIVLGASLAALAVLGIQLGQAAAVAGESRATRATRAGLLAFTALVAVEALLGACAQLTAASTLVSLGVLAIASVLWARRRRGPESGPRPEPWTTSEVAVAAALGAALALRLEAGLHKTTFLYDALSYHLHAPVTWMHDRRLEIVPAVFGDPAPAYAPSNLELAFLFLMAPLRSDALAGAGQLPFAALGALAIVAAVREGGGRRVAALGAALAFLLVPEIWQQAPTAMVDLGMAAFLLAALPFLTRLRAGGTRSDLLALGAALGLAAGTKVVGALLALPFLAAGALAAVRRRSGAGELGAALAVAAIGGGFWYLRNLVLTGNPVYPVAALGFPGLYDGQAMRAWDYHLTVGDLGALGGMLLASGVGFASAAAVGLARAWRSLETALAIALVTIFWLLVPYQESRFLFVAFGVAAVALGQGAHRPPPALGWGALGVAIAGALVAWPTPDRLALVPAAAAGALAHAAWRRIPPPARAGLRRAGLPIVAGTLALTLGIAVHRYEARDPGYAVGDELDSAWSWFRANVRDARVAYTGTNLAFPLAGRALSNRVTYVNVAGGAADRLHDFPSSRGPRGAEPAPYRDGARFDTWLDNLRAAGTEVLFVASLYPIVRRGVGADRRRLSDRARLGRRPPRPLPPALRVGRGAGLRGRTAVKSRAAEIAALAALLLFVAGRCLVPMDETDMFFNLRLGEIILGGHTVPRTNLLSFTAPEYRDVNLAWIFQILLALTYRAGGVPGTVLLKTAFVLATFALLYRVALRRGAHPAAAAAALALCAWAAEPRFVERPHLCTFLGLGFLLLGLERAEAGRARALYALVPLGLVWANANSCFFLAPIVLGLYAAGALLDGRRGDARRAAIVGACLVPLVFATPSGAGALGYIANHWRMPWLRPLQEYRTATLAAGRTVLLRRRGRRAGDRAPRPPAPARSCPRSRSACSARGESASSRSSRSSLDRSSPARSPTWRAPPGVACPPSRTPRRSPWPLRSPASPSSPASRPLAAATGPSTSGSSRISSPPRRSVSPTTAAFATGCTTISRSDPISPGRAGPTTGCSRTRASTATRSGCTRSSATTISRAPSGRRCWPASASPAPSSPTRTSTRARRCSTPNAGRWSTAPAMG